MIHSLPFLSASALHLISGLPNLVELLFNELSRRQLRRLADNSVAELIAAITAYLDHRNADPTPFVWTTSVRSILAKVRKAKDTLASHH